MPQCGDGGVADAFPEESVGIDQLMRDVLAHDGQVVAVMKDVPHTWGFRRGGWLFLPGKADNMSAKMGPGTDFPAHRHLYSPPKSALYLSNASSRVPSIM